MKGHVILALVACALLAGCQPDYSPFDLGNLKIGDASDSVMAKIPAVSCRKGERYQVVECSGKGSTFQGVPVLYTTVAMYDSHVERVGAIVDTSNADSILAAMKVEYGSPDMRPSADMREQLGFTTWTRANGESLEFQRVDGPQSVIFLTGPTYITAHKANPRLDLPRPDIKGVTLGTSMAAVQGLLPASMCKADGQNATCVQRGVTYWNSHDATIEIYLFSDSVKKITVSSLNRHDFEALIEALTKKFGPPNKDVREVSYWDRLQSGIDKMVAWDMPYDQWLYVSIPINFAAQPSVSLKDMEYYNAKYRAEEEAKVDTL